MNKVITLVAVISLGVSLVKAPLQFQDMTIEQRAELAGMSAEDFEFISSVVEAESDRSTEGTEGRVYIALTILNRVNSDQFPDTISGVLNQAGQFSTVRNGHSVTQRSDLSDLAVVEAVEWIRQGDAPAVLFFNCRWFFSGREAYPNPNGGNDIGGNYFSL